MKILVCSPCLTFQADSPYSTRMRALAMQSAGLDVEVFGYPRQYPLKDESLGLAYSSLLETIAPRQVCRLERLQTRFGSLFQFIAEPCLVMRYGCHKAINTGMDVVFFADVEPWVTLLLLIELRLRGIKIPISGMIPGNYHTPTAIEGMPWRTRIRNALNYRLSRYIPRFMEVVGTSQAIVDTLHMNRSKHAHVVPEGHENHIHEQTQAQARAALGIPTGKRMLLLFGVASKAKGSDLLIEALKEVPPDFLVYIVGKTGGVYLSSWGSVDSLKQTGWGENIQTVSRYVSEEEMRNFYAACDAVVIPYRHGFAGTSTHLRRASEYGKAILGCDQHHIGARIREYDLGLVFETENVDSLAACLREFSRKPEAWFQQIKLNSQQLIADESWEQIGLRYRKLFEPMTSLQ